MAAMFYVLSFLLYAKGRLVKENRKGWPWFASCFFTGMLAIGAKETAATLPFFILLYEWYFFQDLSTAWVKRHLPYVIGTLFLLGLLVFLFLGSNPLEAILSEYNHWDFTVAQRLLTEPRVVIHYLSILLYPHPSRLHLDHDFALSYSLFSPITTLLSIGAIVGLIVLAIYMARREPFISFGIVWFLGNLAIESSIIALDLIFEHRTYLPSMLFFPVIVVPIHRYIGRNWVIVGVLSTAILLLCLWTYERNSLWNDPVSFWRDSANKSEKQVRVLNNLGLALAGEGKLDEAVGHYREALRIKPNYAPARNNLGLALARQGKLDEAIAHYLWALRVRADYTEARVNLGIALARQGKLDEAVTHYFKALQTAPLYEQAHYNLAAALTQQGKLDEATAHYSEALRIRPDYAEAHYSLGLVLAGQGKLAQAIASLSEALRIRPDYAEAHYNVAVALGQQGKLDEAIAHYSEALRIKPDYAEAHNNLGIILAHQGKLGEAIAHFSEALRVRPEFGEARENLQKAMSIQGKSR
jgi:tetratricopeptide (TPR) repeat protein